MAEAFLVCYQRDLIKKPLTLQDLCEILKSVHSDIVLSWGSENVTFSHPRNMDEDMIYTMKSLKTDILDSRLYPQSGSSSILGSLVPIKSYTYEEFIDLTLKTKTDMISIMKQSNDMRLKIDYHLYNSGKCKRYIDYSKTITELEKHGYVYTIPSNSFIVTDERRFGLTDKCKHVNINIITQFFESTFEVDSLGTVFCKELTRCIELLYLKVMK